ncbi:hypothetical protein EYC84_002100 [Monilinia fructicola]|uniref:Uncharacterized protein n=1 Tax=Monilinia fructicola TaxID=38448 RepID=A0A5M9JSF8_MONFR|nr:hypothetical protein EYC84_002100 [Monilinia fructicola]
MPFNELQRRDSWPPTIIHLRENNGDMESIDENPFSYFLTSPDEITDDDIDDFSAGIESDEEEKSEVREVSPSALQRAPLNVDDDGDDDDDDVLFGFAMPLSLKDFTRAHESGRESRAAHRASRGRAKVQLAPLSSRGRGQTRSVPLRRPHSWRAPSPDLGSITEEQEGEDAEEGKAEHKAKEISSAPATSRVPSKTVESLKPKKKVHWAF